MNQSQSNHESSSVDAQRAEYEQFSLSVCRGAVGYVNVRNNSYGDDSGSHIYSVEVDAGEAVGCSCPHHVHRNVRCKHIRAVDANPLACSTANVTGGATQVATDGGTTVDQPNEDDDEGETCDRCPTLLADAHDADAGYTVVTTDDEELCPECADNRSGEEIGFGTDDETDSDDEPTRSENVCMDCGGSYPHGETCDCGGMDEL